MNTDRICWENIKVDNIPLNGKQIVLEIERQTGIKTTRQNISNALKSGMECFYKALSKDNPELTPFNVSSLMFEMLYINNIGEHSDFRGGIDSFFRLYPKELRKIIKESALKYCPKASK